MRKIIIISQDHLERAYIGAQLMEEGFEVEGSANLIEAIRHARERKIKPDLIIIDSKEQSFDKEMVKALNRLAPEVRLLLIHGGWDFPQNLEWDTDVSTLARPITVGQVVEKVKEII